MQKFIVEISNSLPYVIKTGSSILRLLHAYKRLDGRKESVILMGVQQESD
jgi:hypothetical protein